MQSSVVENFGSSDTHRLLPCLSYGAPHVVDQCTVKCPQRAMCANYMVFEITVCTTHHSNVNSNLVISMKQNSVLLYLQLESSSDRTLSAHNGFLLLCKECRNRRTHLQRETLLSILQLGRTANSLSKLPAQRLMLEKVQSPRVSSVVYRLAFSLQILYASPRGGQIL